MIIKYFLKLQEYCYEMFVMISLNADFYTYYLKTPLKLISLEKKFGMQ